MKKITVAIMALASAVLAGCSDNAEVTKSNSPIRCEYLGSDGAIVYRSVTIKGHEYVTVKGIECVCLVHSESCPCKAK